MEEEDDDMSSFIFQSIAFSQYSKEEQEEPTALTSAFIPPSPKHEDFAEVGRGVVKTLQDLVARLLQNAKQPGGNDQAHSIVLEAVSSMGYANCGLQYRLNAFLSVT